MKIETLVRQARESAKWRGHKMGVAKITRDLTGRNSDHAYMECKVCKAFVQCLTKPAPNQIDIGGDAVAIHCISRIIPKK